MINNNESKMMQSIIYSSGQLPPACPSLADLLAPLKSTEPKIELKRGTQGYRNNGNGDGWCGRCRRSTKAKDFASQYSKICKTCKAENPYKRKDKN